MMFLETRDDWGGVIMSFTFGGLTDLYQDTTARSAYDLLTGLDAWSQSGSRPWAGKILTWLSWSRDATTSGIKVTIGGSDTFTLAVNATGQSLLGLPASSVGVVTVDGTSGTAGSWSPPGSQGVLAFSRWQRWLDGPGVASGIGAVRPGVPGTAGYRPVVSAVAKAQDVARLMSLVADASHPRRAHIWDEQGDAWRTVALAQVSRSAAGASLWRIDLECYGEAV